MLSAQGVWALESKYGVTTKMDAKTQVNTGTGKVENKMMANANIRAVVHKDFIMSQKELAEQLKSQGKTKEEIKTALQAKMVEFKAKVKAKREQLKKAKGDVRAAIKSAREQLKALKASGATKEQLAQKRSELQAKIIQDYAIQIAEITEAAPRANLLNSWLGRDAKSLRAKKIEAMKKELKADGATDTEITIAVNGVTQTTNDFVEPTE